MVVEKRGEKKRNRRRGRNRNFSPAAHCRGVQSLERKRDESRRISVRCGNNEKRRGGKGERERENLFPRFTGACILSFRPFFFPLSSPFPVDPVAPDLLRRVVEVIKQEIPRHPRGKKKIFHFLPLQFSPSHSDLRNLGCLYGFEFFPISRRHWHESGRKRNTVENTSARIYTYLVIKIFRTKFSTNFSIKLPFSKSALPLSKRNVIRTRKKKFFILKMKNQILFFFFGTRNLFIQSIRFFSIPLFNSLCSQLSWYNRDFPRKTHDRIELEPERRTRGRRETLESNRGIEAGGQGDVLIAT